MKKKKKLTLNKSTVSNLNANKQKLILGGDPVPGNRTTGIYGWCPPCEGGGTFTCGGTCAVTCNQCYTYNNCTAQTCGQQYTCYNKNCAPD